VYHTAFPADHFETQMVGGGEPEDLSWAIKWRKEEENGE
jgi:hypothetical protein